MAIIRQLSKKDKKSECTWRRNLREKKEEKNEKNENDLWEKHVNKNLKHVNKTKKIRSDKASD